MLHGPRLLYHPGSLVLWQDIFRWEGENSGYLSPTFSLCGRSLGGGWVSIAMISWAASWSVTALMGPSNTFLPCPPYGSSGLLHCKPLIISPLLVGSLNPAHTYVSNFLLKSLYMNPLNMPSISHWDPDKYILSTLRKIYCSYSPNHCWKDEACLSEDLCLSHISPKNEKQSPWIYTPGGTSSSQMVGRAVMTGTRKCQ